MSRGLVTGAVVGVLALVTTLLVVLALRPADTQPLPVAPYESGAVAVAGDSVWRWVGPIDCNADADVLQVERSQNNGPWTPAAIPLANVYGLSFANDRYGIATGTTRECARGISVTADGGRTWKSHKDNPVLLDAWFEGNTIWGIERVIGQAQLGAFRINSRNLLQPIKGIKPIQPCDVADGVPDHIAFWNDSTGLLFCENDVVGSRLIARTTNAGSNFERLADNRPSSGLDGGGSVTDMDVAGTETVWLVVADGGECAEGQLRTSDSQGAVFDRLPCPSESVTVDDVIDVAFSSSTKGVMLGLVDREPAMFTTTDGGATWTATTEG